MEEFSPKEQDSLNKTLKDKYWRLTNLYSINSKQGLIKLSPNYIQSVMKRDVEEFNVIRYFILKARQMGVSTWWMAWFLDEVMFHRNYTCGVLAHKWESLQYLIEMLKFLYNNMDKRFQPECDPSGTRLYFPSINSKIFVSLEIRTATLNALHISEICLCKNEAVKATLAGSLSNPNCHIVCESTAKGMQGVGYEMYHSAHEELPKSKNGFKRRFLPWFIHNEYKMSLAGMEAQKVLGHSNGHQRKMIEYAKKHWDITIANEQLYWYKIVEESERELMKQEHPYNDKEAFLATGGIFFNNEKIQALYNEALDFEKDDGYVEVKDDYVMYRRPVRGHVYALGCDTADDGGHYSTIKIIDVTAREEVFLFRARCGLDYLYKQVNFWGRHYYDALAGVEENNHGHAVLLGLDEICKYRNIYKRKTKTRVKIAHKEKTKLGWDTNSVTRPMMLDVLRFTLEGKYEEDVDHFMPEIRYYDKTLLEECFTFIEEGGRIEAAEGKFDDDIMGTSIAIQMYKILRKYINPTTHVSKELRISLNA